MSRKENATHSFLPGQRKYGMIKIKKAEERGMKMKRWICLVGILISLILMLLPEGVAMTFASGPGETIKCFYPFFSRIPLGYGNLFPAASILLSAIGAAFLLFAPRVRPAILTCLGLSILANAASWMLFASFTAVSLGIVLFQAVVLSLQLFFFDERKRPPA